MPTVEQVPLTPGGEVPRIEVPEHDCFAGRHPDGAAVPVPEHDRVEAATAADGDRRAVDDDVAAAAGPEAARQHLAAVDDDVVACPDVDPDAGALALVRHREEKGTVGDANAYIEEHKG